MSFLAPSALLTPVEEGLDVEDCTDYWSVRQRCNDNGDILPLRYGYVRSLKVGNGWIGKGRRVGGGLQQQRSEEYYSRQQVTGGFGRPETVYRRSHHRSMSEPLVDSKRMMAAGVEETAEESTAPNSPPELSYSKSSKSSASSESDSSDENLSSEKLDKSDDASTDGRDSIEDSNLRPESRPTLRRPQPRSVTLGAAGGKILSPPLPGKEHGYPSLRTAVNGVLRDQSLNLPHGRGMRRTFTTPASPSYMMGEHQRLSRSPSPNKPMPQNGMPMKSPRMSAGLSPRPSDELRSPGLQANSGMFGRRKSWQPGRKSVKELEAEYDNLEEEVPEEAILENVPISPMPGQYRLSPRSSRSTTPSPHRRQSHTSLHSVLSHSNLHSANVPKNAKRPSAPTILPNGQYGTPRSPRHPRYPTLRHSNTLPAFLEDPMARRHRSKSWTEDLNDEARALSAALEEFAERMSLEKSQSNNNSGTNSVASSPPRPSFPKQRAQTTIMDMPPISYGSIMIDPLPISKEKEAVLGKTRPSWLPPKDQKEEKKHLKEWEAMMARAAENEKKRQLKERESQEDGEEMRDSLARIWEQHVLPDWENVINEPRTRELWWRGVTPKNRGEVWRRAIGNELQVSEETYTAALRHANEVEAQLMRLPAGERSASNEAAYLDAIARDVCLTCPELSDTSQRGPYESSLSDVLRAYAFYRTDIGYVYGTHLIAGVLCLYLKPVDAFIALANLLNRPLSKAFLENDADGMKRFSDLVLSTLKYKFPRLHDHLTSGSVELKVDEWLEPMMRCLFGKTLGTEVVSRIWDVMAFEGDKAVVRAAVAVLGRVEGKLYGSKEEILRVLGWQNEKVLDVGTEDEFMKAMRDAGKVDARGEEVKAVYV